MLDGWRQVAAPTADVQQGELPLDSGAHHIQPPSCGSGTPEPAVYEGQLRQGSVQVAACGVSAPGVGVVHLLLHLHQPTISVAQ